MYENIVVVRILKDGFHAKEVNPMGNEPPRTDFREGYKHLLSPALLLEVKAWNKSEKKLRTFEIDSEKEALLFTSLKRRRQLKKGEIKLISAAVMFKPDTIRKAKILPSGKIKILN